MIYKVEVYQENLMGIFNTYFVEADSIATAEQQAIGCAVAYFAEKPYVQSACIYVARIDDPNEMKTKRGEADQNEGAATP